MSAQAVHKSSPHFLSTLKPQRVAENADVHLSCSVSGNPEPEVTWYKGDKQLPNVLESTKYEMLKDGKVHTLKLHRCAESDASAYQVSARNSKGFAICSTVLQVGFITEAQVKRQMMQKLEDRNRAGKAPNSPEVNSPRGHSDDGPTATADIHLEHAENGARPPAEAEAARRFEGIPAPSGRISSAAEGESSAVSLHPNTGKRHQLNEVPVTGAESQMNLSVRDQSYNPRMDDVARADFPRGTKRITPTSDGDFIRESLPKSALQSSSPVPLCGETPPLSTDEEYYLDFLVCSDVLNDEDDAAWRQKLHSRTHLLSSAESEDPEIDKVILTRYLSPLGHSMTSTSAPCCQPKGWLGRTPASEGSRAPAKAADQTCSVSSELPTEIGVASRERLSLERSPASVNGLQEMTAGGKGVELISAGRADFVSLEEGKTTEARKRQVLKEECWQNTSLEEDNPESKRSRRSEESHSTGELLDTGEMYQSPPRINAAQLFAVNESAADGRLPRANDSPANIPPALANHSPGMEGERIRGRKEETSAVEKRSSSSEGAKTQPLLLKDEGTSFTEIITVSYSEDDHIVCHEKRTNLLPLDRHTTLPSIKYSQDQEDTHPRLKEDFQIFSVPPVLDSAISQHSKFKHKHQVQVLQENISNLISRDTELICTCKENQGTTFEATIEHTRHFTDCLKRDSNIESMKSDFSENTSICNNKLEPSKISPGLYIYNEHTDHQSSESCESKDSNKEVVKKVGKYGSIGPALNTSPCSTKPTQITDISELENISSDKFQDIEEFDKRDLVPSYTNSNNGARHDEITLQVTDKDLTGHFEESVLENQKDDPKSHCPPPIEAKILCPLNASESEVHKDDLPTCWSIQYGQTTENEVTRNCSCSHHSNEGVPGANKSAAFQRDDELPVEPLLECNLALLSNQLVSKHVAFDSETNGSDYSSEDRVLAKPLIAHLKEASSPMLTDCEKMRYNEPSLLESPCCDKTKSNDNEGISSARSFEKDDVYKMGTDMDKNQQGNDYELVYKHVSKCPVIVPTNEDEYFNLQLRTGQGSETMLPSKHYVGHENSNEFEVVALDNRKLSVPELVDLDQTISPSLETTQQRMINTDRENGVNETKYYEHPTQKEQKSTVVEPVVVEQSIGHQQIPGPVQNSLEHVVEVEMDDDHGEIINDLMNSLTEINPAAFNDESHVRCLSIQAPDKIKAPENETIINPSGSFKSIVKLSSHVDINLSQSTDSQAEKSTVNHNIPFIERDNELSHDFVNDKTISTENMPLAEVSVSPIMNVPSKTEQVRGLISESTATDLNEDIQNAKPVHVTNVSEKLKFVANNNDKMLKSQGEGQLDNSRDKEDNNQTIQQNDSFHLPSIGNEGSSIITQQVTGQLMNVDSTAPENCMECHENNIKKSNAPDHPLEYIKINTGDESKGKICQMSRVTHTKCWRNSTGQAASMEGDKELTFRAEILHHDSAQKSDICQMSLAPSKTNQKTSTVSKIEKVKPNKNDNQAKITITQTITTSLDEGQQRTTGQELPISLQNQSLSKKRIPPAESHSAAVRTKQTTLVEPVKELTNSGAWKRSNSSSDVASECGDLFSSQSEQQKNEEVTHMLSAEKTKFTLDKKQQMQPSSAGKENLNKTKTVIKRIFHGAVEKAVIKKEQEVEKVKDPQKEEHKETLSRWEDSSLGTPQDSVPDAPEFNQLKSSDLSMGIQGEKIELLQPIIEKELASECTFQPKIYGSIATEETHFGEGLHRKAFRTKVIYGLVPLFDPGHSCVLKIHNAISYGTKTKNELIQRNYILAIQECHVQNAARQYSNMFSAAGTSIEGFGEAPEIIPIYLIHRPANSIPYATVEEELIGDFVKYSVKDGREMNVGRKESEVGQKCCTFQHWVYEWTEGNLLVTDLQGTKDLKETVLFPLLISSKLYINVIYTAKLWV
ncbi:alpha-protein kinase 2 isoform X2 [Hemitrygon akajei]|uniref:alpha-protein kinase 2 isoform X2 n=1 Tax=Hemitrygon akajei TaxID=2704970 RepID=UPI003BFA12D6